MKMQWVPVVCEHHTYVDVMPEHSESCVSGLHSDQVGKQSIQLPLAADGRGYPYPF